MSAALIGVLGVIIGAALTTYLTTLNEKRNQARAAYGAGLLLASELSNADVILDAAIKGKHWFVTPLPTEAWQTHQVPVAAELPTEVVDRLSMAYASLVTTNQAAVDARSQTTPAGTAKPEKLTDSDIATLHTVKAKVKEATANLTSALNVLKVRTSWLSPQRKRLALGVGIVAAAWLMIYAATPRPNPTPVSIADAVTQELGPGFHVDCDTDSADWICQVTQFQSATCELEAAGRSPGTQPPSRLVSASSTHALPAASAACAVASEAEFDASLDEDAEVISVVPQPAPNSPDSPQQGTLTPQDEAVPQWQREAMALSTREPPIEERPAKSWWKRLFGG